MGGVGAVESSEFDAGVVHALLQARYYDSGKGAFLSEDPVFLGEPKHQVLTDPQSLNSYSYANDNPVTKSDPTGRTYLELSAAGTFEGWSGSVGVRADLYGINVFAAGGFGVGTLFCGLWQRLIPEASV